VYIINLDIHKNEIPETLLHRVQIRNIQWTRLKFSTYDLLHIAYVLKKPFSINVWIVISCWFIDSDVRAIYST